MLLKDGQAGRNRKGMVMIKCKDCGYKTYLERNGNPNRYHCEHPEARYARSECEPTPMICRTKRYSKELTIATSPKWCPRRKEKRVDSNDPKDEWR